MNMSSVLQQLSYVGTVYDAAKEMSQGGYVKRVTKVYPSSVTTLPDGATADTAASPVATAPYRNTGTDLAPVYELKESYTFTYTAPSGSKVVGPGSIAEPADSVTVTVDTTARYPICIVFVAKDGSEFLLNLSHDDTSSALPSEDPTDIARETAVAYVPTDRSLFLHLASDGWNVGTISMFGNANSASAIW